MNKAILAVTAGLQLVIAIGGSVYWLRQYELENGDDLRLETWNEMTTEMWGRFEPLANLEDHVAAKRQEHNALVMGRLIVTLALVVVYFVPTHIATARKHPHTVTIFIVNLFAAWTVVCWVGTLAWAVWPAQFPPSE